MFLSVLKILETSFFFVGKKRFLTVGADTAGLFMSFSSLLIPFQYIFVTSNEEVYIFANPFFLAQFLEDEGLKFRVLGSVLFVMNRMVKMIMQVDYCQPRRQSYSTNRNSCELSPSKSTGTEGLNVLLWFVNSWLV